MPKQRCGLLAGQPSVAGLTFGRERHSHYAAVKAFLCVVIDRGAQCLKVAASATRTAAMFGVACTSLGINLRQLLATPILVEPLNAGLDLELVAGLANVGQINREDISTIDVLNVLAAPFGLILTSDVVR
ncbi:hypothetical protein [Bradyrhizobium sp. STM 3562]|uniref:hypothetical protein n=1 Tax=Bradyrhizobium sp. STM 3562 TaxID=578924 RepID=UPI003891060B